MLINILSSDIFEDIFEDVYYRNDSYFNNMR